MLKFFMMEVSKLKPRTANRVASRIAGPHDALRQGGEAGGIEPGQALRRTLRGAAISVRRPLIRVADLIGAQAGWAAVPDA
jgi:hypothetical protein